MEPTDNLAATNLDDLNHPGYDALIWALLVDPPLDEPDPDDECEHYERFE